MFAVIIRENTYCFQKRLAVKVKLTKIYYSGDSFCQKSNRNCHFFCETGIWQRHSSRGRATCHSIWQLTVSTSAFHDSLAQFINIVKSTSLHKSCSHKHSLFVLKHFQSALEKKKTHKKIPFMTLHRAILTHKKI